MAEVTYRPAHVKGEVRIPPSKSAAHRALLSAALCKTPCRVGPIDHSADMEATLNCVCAMGGTVKTEESGVLCIAPGTAPQSVTVDCGESGSTLRFFIPLFSCPAPAAGSQKGQSQDQGYRPSSSHVHVLPFFRFLLRIPPTLAKGYRLFQIFFNSFRKSFSSISPASA